MKMNRIEIETNNGRSLCFTQYDHSDAVFVSAHDGLKCEYEMDIPASDMVMLWNFYRYVKDNDIRNDFINPNGKKVEA